MRPSAAALALKESTENPILLSPDAQKGVEAPLLNDYLAGLQRQIDSGGEAALQEAVSRLEQVSPEDPSFLWVQVLLGAAHYKLEQYQRAANYFETVASDELTSTENQQWAEYYQLLSIMQTGAERQAFQPAIEKIKATGPGHTFFPRMAVIETALEGH